MSYLLGPEDPRVPRTVSEASLLALADAVGLRERAGDWPKVAPRWREVLRSSRRRVLLDLSEGDPLSAHQASLAVLRPRALLEGLSLALLATRAEEAVLAVSDTHPQLPDVLRNSLEGGALGSTPFRVLAVKSDPVANLDGSLAAAALGRFPVPTELPAGAAAAGVAVHRPETLLQLRRAVHVGAQEFSRNETFLAGMAAGDEPPVLKEVRVGTALSAALRDAHKTAEPDDLILLGSALSAPIRYSEGMPLAPDPAAAAGAPLGGGGIRILGKRTSSSLRLHVAALAASSCGQCPSCTMAAGVILQRMEGNDDTGLLRIARHARGKGLCPLLDAMCDGAEQLGQSAEN